MIVNECDKDHDGAVDFCEVSMCLKEHAKDWGCNPECNCDKDNDSAYCNMMRECKAPKEEEEYSFCPCHDMDGNQYDCSAKECHANVNWLMSMGEKADTNNDMALDQEECL